MFRLEKPLCPECNEPAGYIVETILANVGIQPVAPGQTGTEFEYDGTGTQWEGSVSEPDLDGDGNGKLQCSANHEWISKVWIEDNDESGEEES